MFAGPAGLGFFPFGEAQGQNDELKQSQNKQQVPPLRSASRYFGRDDSVFYYATAAAVGIPPVRCAQGRLCFALSG